MLFHDQHRLERPQGSILILGIMDLAAAIIHVVLKAVRCGPAAEYDGFSGYGFRAT